MGAPARSENKKYSIRHGVDNRERVVAQVKNKIIYLQELRVFAIYWVIFNHTGGAQAFAWQPIPSLHFLLYTAFSLLCKTAVPIFFMISGALLLNRGKDWRWLSKKILRMAVVLIITTVAYVIYKRIRYGEIHGVIDTLKYLYEGSDLSAHLWFLYAYLAFLLSIPIIDRVIKDFKTDIFYYLVGMYMLVRVVYALQFLIASDGWSIRGDIFPSWMQSDIFIYPIVGYALDKHFDEIKKKYKILMIAISAAAFIVNVFMILVLAERNGYTFDGVYSQQFHNHFVLLYAMVIFGLFKKKESLRKRSKVYGLIISKIGEATFGVYIIHIIVKDLRRMQAWLDHLVNDLNYDYLLANLLYVFVVLIICTVLVMGYRFIISLAKTYIIRQK